MQHNMQLQKLPKWLLLTVPSKAGKAKKTEALVRAKVKNSSPEN